MKKFYIVIVICSVSLLAGINLIAQEQNVGTVHEIIPEKKEILVEYYQISNPLQMGEKLHLFIDNEYITLEVTFPLQTQARCRLAAKDAARILQIKKGMIVYSGANVLKKQEPISRKRTYKVGSVVLKLFWQLMTV